MSRMLDTFLAASERHGPAEQTQMWVSEHRLGLSATAQRTATGSHVTPTVES